MIPFDTARAAVDALTINRLAITGTSASPNYAHAEKLLRQDVLAILGALEADVEAAVTGSFTMTATGPTYCRACGVGMLASAGSEPKCEPCAEMEAMEAMESE